MDTSLPSSMRGAVLLGPEQVEIRELPLPLPGPGELLMKVRAALTCGTDVKVFRRGGHPRMLKVPTLFGHEMSGTVAKLGDGVTQFSPGEAVVVANSACCGECDACASGRENLCRDLAYLNGAFAEYLLLPERFASRSTYRIPNGLTFAHAAMTEPLACVLHGVEACELSSVAGGGSAEIIIYGAGPIGLLFAATLSRLHHRVILADPNPERLEVGRSMGAAECVRVGRDGNQSALVCKRTRNGEGAHVVVDCTGVPAVWEDAVASVRSGGLVNLFGGCAPGSRVSLDIHRVHYSELTIKGVYHHRPENVRDALAMLAGKKIDADLLLSGEHSIDQVEEALRRMMRREALKLVIRSV